jgi:hypothetical protein
MPTFPPPMGAPAATPPEPSLRERVARLKTLARRGLAYWKMGLLLFLVGCGVALAFAFQVKLTYRSECTLLAKPRFHTDDKEDSELQGAKLEAKLRDIVTTRSRLETAIKKFSLYPKTTQTKTVLDAVEDMRPHVGVRGRESGRYVISFDGDDGVVAVHAPGDVQTTVQQVTQYLADSLVEEYTSSNLGDLKRESEFLASQESSSEQDLEKATRELTVFLAAHPEFAQEANAASTPFGPAFGPNPTMGIPLNLPKVPKAPPGVTDPELAALYRERSRLIAEARAGTGAPAPTPATTAAHADAIAQAQAEVEAAAKRVAETQADVASKAGSLTEDHPDMIAARAAAAQAAQQLHAAKVKLSALQTPGGISTSNPYDAPGQLSPELQEKVKQVDAQIATRQAQIQGKSPPAPRPSDVGAAASSAPSQKPVEPMSPVVALETDWQRLLRGVSEAKVRHDDLKLRAEKAKLSAMAAQATANDVMSVVEPAERPTHPAKGGRTNAAILGGLLAILVALGYMAARVVFNDTIIDADDVGALKLIPVLGVIPKVSVTTPAPSQSISPKGGAPGRA